MIPMQLSGNCTGQSVQVGTRYYTIIRDRNKLMIYWKQFKSVFVHKWYVFRAGRLTGVFLWRLIIHDWSKFTPTELFGYAGNSGGSTDKGRWAKAWLHHLHYNPHHPEHWILSWRGNPKFYDEIGQGVAPFVTILPMPETYVREMIADMMATGYKVSGSWNISNWLNQNGPDMHFHDDTITLIDKVLKEVGYTSRIIVTGLGSGRR